MKQTGLGILGAATGGAFGYFLFVFAAGQGFYALAVPGCLLGWGCSAASRIYSKPLGIASAVGALGLGVFTEWKYAPFVDDDSFLFFIQNLFELKSITLIMIGLGTIAGYWFGVGRGMPHPHTSPTNEVNS